MRALLLLLCLVPAAAQDWRSYGGDPGGMKYSALDQVTRANVADLEEAWSYDTGDSADGSGRWPYRSAFASTPLMNAITPSSTAAGSLRMSS